MFGANTPNNPFGGGGTNAVPASTQTTTSTSMTSGGHGSISSGTPGFSAFSNKANNPPSAFGSANVFGSGVSGSFTNPFGVSAPTALSSAATSSGSFAPSPSNPFGQDTTASAAKSTPNIFGDTTSANVFGGPLKKTMFETPKPSKSANVFGTPTAASSGLSGGGNSFSGGSSKAVSTSSQLQSGSIFGQNLTSNSTVPSNVFRGRHEATTTSSAFSGAKAFGGKAEQSQTPPAAASRAFGGGASSAVFGSKTSSALSVFGKKAPATDQRSSSAERRRNIRLSTEATKVAIVCTSIPEQSFSKFSLKQHFSKFGEVTRLYLNEDRKRATVHFRDHKSAERALNDGGSIHKGHPKMSIFWAKHTPKPASSQDKNAADIDDELSSASSAMPGSVFSSEGHKPRKEYKALSTILKSRSVSPEPRRSASPSTRAEKPGAAHFTLKGVGGTAHTTQDRVAILEHRDKLCRQTDEIQGKHADLATAKALKGTCPDMCPELERYLRESRHRLHRYETIPGTSEADHAKVVKEYSRSSADQGMPLPLEVRSGPVLQATMDYLLGHIIDKGQDGQWYDWYDFLWNRMRSIRKDITQQLLCDQSAVDLVQKCVRFHIYCAHRLCEEDLMTFDQKINDENLTKCLQTLKEFYEDMDTQGKAPAVEEEAEFRAYIVLMNLNQGDVLRNVQTLRREIRESPAMRFVVSVYTALNSHNFVRFFRCVHQAPFLMASVMHRYFGQVRSRALMIITRAYNEKIPLSKLVNQLAFENEDEAGEFCVHHGLTIDSGCVQTSGARFIHPENIFPQKRAVHVIESKQKWSIGDVVNGKPLAKKPPPIPSSSFNASGNFVGGNILLQQETMPTEEPQVQSQPVQPKPVQPKPAAIPAKPDPPPIQFSNEVVKELTKEIFREVIDEMALKIASPVVGAIKIYYNQAEGVGEQVIRDVVDPRSKQMAEETHKEMSQLAAAERKARAQALEAHEKAQSKLRSTDLLMRDILQETLNKEIDDAARQQMDEVIEQLTSESRDRVTRKISDVLLGEMTIRMCGSLANEIFQTDVVDRLQQLSDAEHAVKVMRQAKFFYTWKNRLLGRMKLQRSMNTFPPAPSLASLPSQLRTLLPQSEGLQADGSIHLGGTGYLTSLPLSRLQVSDVRLSLQVSVHQCTAMLRKERAWRPLDVCGMLEPLAKQRMREFPYDERALQWKLVLSSPVRDETTEWVQAKLRKGAVPSDDLLSLHSSPLGNTESNVGVCIRYVGDVQGEDRSLLGAQALLFIVHEADIEDSKWRLHFLIDSRPLNPPIPLVVAHGNCFSDSELERSLGLASLVSSRRICSWKLILLPSDVELAEASDNLASGVGWLCNNWPPPATIKRKALREVVEDQVGERYFNPVSQNLTKLRSQGRLDQHPRLLCELYNCVLTHLSVALSHADLQDFSVPIPEFHSEDKDWNTACQLKDLRDFLMALRLPMVVRDKDSSDGWNEACVGVYRWLRGVSEEAPALYSRVRWLLKKAEEDLQDSCLIQLRLDKCRPNYANVPWTEIINACIEHRLSALDYTQESEVYVYYLASHLTHFRPPSSWLKADLDEIPSDATSVNNSLMRAAKKRLADASPDEFLRPKVPRNLPQLRSLSPTEKEAKDLGHLLETSIKISQQEGHEYEEYLAKVLEDESNDPVVTLTQLGDFQVEDSFQESPSLLEEFTEQNLSLVDGMDLLNDSLMAQQNAGRMYELKLQRFLNDSL